MLGDFSTQRVTGSQADAVHRALRIQSHGADDLEIWQFEKRDLSNPRRFESLEALLIDISVRDLGCLREDVRIVMSGNNEFPYDAREQWTDSCNVLAIQEGVVLSYDRNDKTTEAFRSIGFDVVHVADLLADLESGKVHAGDLTDTLVLMPSAELSRARGGFHCMSMPLWRAS